MGHRRELRARASITSFNSQRSLIDTHWALPPAIHADTDAITKRFTRRRWPDVARLLLMREIVVDATPLFGH